MGYSCIYCGTRYPESGLPYLCPVCGGIFDFEGNFPIRWPLRDRTKPGIWEYQESFGLDQDVEPVSLGEGNTPLVWADVFGRKVAFKCEFMNPSGSFKDRGSAIIAAMLRKREVLNAVEDSSGNAGASIACYAARAGVGMRVFIPSSASGPKRRQIAAFGGQLVSISGSRRDVSSAVLEEIKKGVVYASHAYLPFNLPGYATIAYEIYDQLGGNMPGTIMAPVGQGGLLLGVARGFGVLRVANKDIHKQPIFIGVQAHSCAPIWDAFTANSPKINHRNDTSTLAEGVRVLDPIRKKDVLQVVTENNGSIHVVEESDILFGRDSLAHLGLYVEPTSAIVWPVLDKEKSHLPDPIVIILTGSGLKSES